jgi:membrane associated rhomboid family serine protease
MLIGLVAPIGMTLGASGAIYALLLGYAMMFPDRIIMPLFPPIPMKAKYAVIVFGVMALFLGMTGGGGIAHFAHLGGMLGGWLMLRFWRGQAPFSRRRF